MVNFISLLNTNNRINSFSDFTCIITIGLSYFSSYTLYIIRLCYMFNVDYLMYSILLSNQHTAFCMNIDHRNLGIFVQSMCIQ